MTRTESQPVEKDEIKRYLYAESSEDERAAIEEKLFADDELFYAVANLENELIDLYAQNKLTGEELNRFERGLNKLPARRQKIANAVALQTFIEEEKQFVEESVAIPARQTFWQKLADFFTVKTPAFGYAMTGMLVLLTVFSAIFFLDSRRKSAELARLQNEHPLDEQSQQRQELQNQLSNLRVRESELTNRIDEERQTSGDLTEELERERQKRNQIERELQELPKKANEGKTPQSPQTPVIASVFLTPAIGVRGGDGSGLGTKTVSIGQQTTRLAVSLALPDAAAKNERYSIRLNEKTVAQDLLTGVAPGGKKNLRLTIPTRELLNGKNELTVVNSAENEIGKYVFSLERQTLVRKD